MELGVIAADAAYTRVVEAIRSFITPLKSTLSQENRSATCLRRVIFMVFAVANTRSGKVFKHEFETQMLLYPLGTEYNLMSLGPIRFTQMSVGLTQQGHHTFQYHKFVL
jgi:hypothetical protein